MKRIEIEKVKKIKIKVFKKLEINKLRGLQENLRIGRTKRRFWGELENLEDEIKIRETTKNNISEKKRAKLTIEETKKLEIEKTTDATDRESNMKINIT